ncbi:FAD:protein FMN transferase [Paenibacillus aceris]|uniref:FAD:protein FMN transferase n=2 Tax=Paenibacillus aceris TaxID=869555 RepID=A0ABS4I3B6_9BACL|nr:thiamine biosynthesis lipoprotein [Paenibacillus aceris]NHW36076.1 FAD:protein FMN transferase [Paenibacillus aceris]
MKKTKLFMDTVVDIQVVVADHSRDKAAAAVDRAFEVFRKVEQACSRFSRDSEVMKATRQLQTAVKISPFIFEPLRFALEVAEVTNGMFDPTVGKAMEDYGFNQHYLTGETIQSSASDSATYQDILLDEEHRTLYVNKPLVIDLGAVAKGFAIDLAAHELKNFEGFIVNAGGDLFAGGLDKQGRKWKIGIQHPIHKDQVIQMIEVSNEAVCTSGSYERKSPLKTGIHHLMNPCGKHSPNEWISCSVIAPYALMADAFSTAAFVLEKDRGKALLEEVNLKGILIDQDLQINRIGGI